MSLRTLTLVAVVLAQVSCAWSHDLRPPDPLPDADFWTLVTSLSEPAGEFAHADNLVSNEAHFAQVAQRLRPAGGVYIGVGPEQNFSYIARLQPDLAFIVDIRAENRDLHLMYKALFEISSDRMDFLGRLFSRERPSGIQRLTPVDELFARVTAARPSASLYEETSRLIRAQLMEVRGFPLTADDLHSVDESLRAFFSDGPDIRYGRALPRSPTRPSYRHLMTAKDLSGQARSYLATEDAFAYVKSLHAGNRLVPVVGDFAGPSALRRVADYVRQQHEVVSAFYSSNVEVYLTRDQRRAFCANLATLPHDERTWFIASKRREPLTAKLSACTAIEPSLRWP